MKPCVFYLVLQIAPKSDAGYSVVAPFTSQTNFTKSRSTFVNCVEKHFTTRFRKCLSFFRRKSITCTAGTAETMEGVMLRNIFRNNIDEKQTVVRKTVKRDNETDKFVCFLTALEQTSGISVS